jgi:cell division protein FtsL
MIDTTSTSSLPFQILEENQKILEQRQEASDAVNNRISNQISSATYALEIFSVLVTIAGIVLAWHIDSSYKKIRKIRQEVNSTKKYIDNNNEELFKRLERNETLGGLQRLLAVPEDIDNKLTWLFSRDLHAEDFNILKQAYSSEGLDEHVKESYIPVFMQHFPYQTLADEVTYPKAVDSLLNLRGMFRRDVENLFKGILKYIKINGIDNEASKIVIRNFIKGLYASKHKILITTLKQKCLGENLDVPQVLKAAVSEEDEPLFIEWLNS